VKRSLWIFVLSLVLFGCNKGVEEHAHEEAGHKEEEAHSEDIVLTPDAAKIAGIELVTVKRMPMQAEFKVPGTVTTTAQGRALVTPPTAGKITQIYVKVGDSVKAGQPIATLQSADLTEASAGIIEAQRDVITAQAAVHEARSQIDLANAKLRTAKQVLKRQEDFAKTGAFSQPALQAAQRELGDAEADLERGKQDQVVHQAQLERAERLFKQELISRTELEQTRLEVETDKIRQRNAERRIDLAKATFEREQSILKRGLANSREVQGAEAEVRSANIEVAQAKIRLRSAQAGLTSAQKGVQAARASYGAQAGGGRASGGHVTVVAPIAGVITDREATLGQAVERTTEICEIENLRTVWVTAQVPEKHIDKVRKGSSAQISVSTFPGQTFSGIVQVLGGRLDPKSRTMPVQILVDNADGKLRAEMFASVFIGVGGSDNVLAAPRSAIVDGKMYLAEEGGKYEEKTVELGRIKGDWVEVLSGLEEGAQVVTKGAFVLKSEKVKAELKGHEH
jgi:membrane fusion protein, heavy metal efflux system